jgi:hypothetical protein
VWVACGVDLRESPHSAAVSHSDSHGCASEQKREGGGGGRGGSDSLHLYPPLLCRAAGGLARTFFR